MDVRPVWAREGDVVEIHWRLEGGLIEVERRTCPPTTRYQVGGGWGDETFKQTLDAADAEAPSSPPKIDP